MRVFFHLFLSLNLNTKPRTLHSSEWTSQVITQRHQQFPTSLRRKVKLPIMSTETESSTVSLLTLFQPGCPAWSSLPWGTLHSRAFTWITPDSACFELSLRSLCLTHSLHLSTQMSPCYGDLPSPPYLTCTGYSPFLSSLFFSLAPPHWITFGSG